MIARKDYQCAVYISPIRLQIRVHSWKGTFHRTRLYPVQTETDSGISALCDTDCTSSLSFSVSISFSTRWAISPSIGIVLLGRLVISEASMGILAVSIASFTLR